MSCNYADGLSPYEDKGVLGTPEYFEPPEKVKEKAKLLADWIRESKRVVVHTGAGISTAAGIPDFRGPNGVWTLERKGVKPESGTPFDEAVPTKTHMALKKLLEVGLIKYIVSQNIDGLHLKSGVSRDFISELHGNMFVERCDTCQSQFVRTSSTPSVGLKPLDEDCRRKSRKCRGKLFDTILDWESSLPERDLQLAECHSESADLNLCLGTTLQITPSGKLPLSAIRFGGRLAIVNLQPTKYDAKADLTIGSYVDAVMEEVMKCLGLEIPEYDASADPTRVDMGLGWDIPARAVKEMKRASVSYRRDFRNSNRKRNADKKESRTGEVKVKKTEDN